MFAQNEEKKCYFCANRCAKIWLQKSKKKKERISQTNMDSLYFLPQPFPFYAA